ncbi:AT-hook motif nuclear-localized protein 10-like [Curcuma longa]|uniref:AT-hook motif nuclear-localized protein 10-like n=1 Tax=Curcuma longa TaxID=136217 RepID=UPI003D9F58A7
MERNPMLGPPAMHSMQLATYTVVGQPFLTTLASSSAAHPQPSPYHQGDGGGGLPGVLDGGFTAQAVPGEPAKRKRGRPKKYGPNGTLLSLSQPTASMSFSGVSNAAPSKKRGRPLGSCKKQQTNAPGSSGMKLHVHCIDVPAGEDVVSKIVSYFQQGSHSVCILSTCGVASEVKVFQPTTTGCGIVGYQGLFEILSLTGTLMLPLPDNTEQQRLVSGLTITLANKDGCVFGGGLAGLLLAASPVQVVVGRFVPEGTNESKQANAAKVVPVLNLVSGGIANTSNPPSRDALSESSGDLRSLPMQNAGTFNYINSLGL